MAVIYTKKPVTGSVSVTNSKTGVEHKEEIPLGSALVADESFASSPILKSAIQRPANVGVMLNYTKNLGNYESLKVQVSLHLPAENVDTEIDAAFDRAFKWVEGKVKHIVEDT